jgi:hypothetical protein
VIAVPKATYFCFKPSSNPKGKKGIQAILSASN